MSRRTTEAPDPLRGLRSGSRGRLAAAPLVVMLAVALASCASTADPPVKPTDRSVTVIATATPAPAPDPASLSPRSAPEKPGYKLLFNDEFVGGSLDTTRWATSLPWGNTNRAEQQYYTPRNLTVRDGLLTITARKEQTNGLPYSSGVISSFERFTFMYGYAEIRAKSPAGTGLWPAFWLPATVEGTNDEIDVMELLGSDPSLGYAVLHYGTTREKRTDVATYRNPDFSAGFHTFAVEWEPAVIVWYVDGVERRRVTENVPSQPMYLITNLAVGGEASWSGAPDRHTVFPAELQVDYIRVYQRR